MIIPVNDAQWAFTSTKREFVKKSLIAVQTSILILENAEDAIKDTHSIKKMNALWAQKHKIMTQGAAHLLTKSV